VKIISFSGIDGAGKTTQICGLEAWLRQAGLGVTLMTFWDDVVVFPRFREFMSHTAFRGDQGIGTPARPLNRRDKNVTSWPLTAMRFCLYFADAVNLRRKVFQIQIKAKIKIKRKKSDPDMVIFDRYLYDELANLPLNRWLARVFIRFLLKLAPQPDMAYLIDADPVAARARKPEYPLEFLRSNREAYLTLSHLAGGITIIEPLPIEAAKMKIREAFMQKLAEPQKEFSGSPALP
jgi:thymidylate kinase